MFKKVNPLQILFLGTILNLTVSNSQAFNNITTETPQSVNGATTNRTCVDNEKRIENQIACKGEPFGELVPYPGDCAKFLVCNCEYPTVKDCAAGTWFDNKLKVCNWPQSVKCDYGEGGATSTIGTTLSTPPPTTAKLSTVTPSLNVATTIRTCVDNEKRLENQIACKGQPFGELVPYPGDCAKFLVCNCEYPTVKDCAPGTWFDNKLKVCNWPQSVKCDDNGSSAIGTTLSTSPPTTTTTTSDNEWGINCETPEGMSSDICLNYENGFLLRYPYDCNAYINCTQGCPILTHCLPDKVFNALLKICDTPETAHCESLPLPNTTTTKEPTTTGSTTGKPTTTKTTTRQPTTLTTTTVTQPTTTKTTTSEPTTTTTTTITTQKPTTTTPLVCNPPNGVSEDICSLQVPGTLLPYSYNCSAYILCNWRCPQLKYCENDTVFNSLLAICDSDVQCFEMPYPDPETTQSSTEKTENGTTISPETTATTDHPFTTSLPADVNPELCKSEEDYKLYPYEGNCQQYLSCMKGKVELKSCPNGWLFNAQLGMCDEAGEDVCFKGTTTSTTETSSTTEAPVSDVCIGERKGASFPYTENCQMYYYCQGNGSYDLVSCPFNNYYEPYSGNCGPDVSPIACKIPITTTTTVATTLTPAEMCEGHIMGDTIPNLANCRQYIMCMGNGHYQILRCPGNNFYYPESGSCGPSEDEDICRKGTGTTVTTPSTTTTSIPNTTSTTTSTTTTTASSVAPSNGICGSFTNGQLIEYPNNCQKYISCVRPIPIAFYCPNNWYFAVNQQKCIPNTNGACSEQPPTTTIPTPTDICVNQDPGEWQIYPTNCEMYYECLGNGYYMLNICTEGEYFNPQTGNCSRNVDANYCQQDFDTTTVITPTVSPKPPQNLCWEKPLGSKVPYPQECSKYIVCELPIPVGYSCPPGLLFSSVTESCVDPQDSDCGTSITITPTLEPTITTNSPPTTTPTLEPTKTTNSPPTTTPTLEPTKTTNSPPTITTPIASTKTTTQTTTQTNTQTTDQPTTRTTPTIPPITTQSPAQIGNICCGKESGTLLPYPNDETKYVICLYPLPQVSQCPANTTFDPKTSECKSNLLVVDMPASLKLPCGSGLAYEGDCTKFYVCFGSKAMIMTCGENWLFNASLGSCVPAQLYNCPW